MVGILCLLLAFASSGLRAQGEVVFPDLDWAVRSARVVRRHVLNTDSLVAERHQQALSRLQQRQYVRVGEILHRLSPNASGREVAAALQHADSLRTALQQGLSFADAGGELRWTRLAEELQECADVLAALPKDSVSQPFLSPLGVHLLLWTDCLSEVPLAEDRARLESWAESKLTSMHVPFHTDLDSLCALYPSAEPELRALHEQMLREARGETEEADKTSLQPMTKAEKKAAKERAKAEKKAEKLRLKAEKKAAKRKNIVKKQ
jgi:hypothetical protein